MIDLLFATVTDVADPSGEGGIRFSSAELLGAEDGAARVYPAWARPASPAALASVPRVGDTVVVGVPRTGAGGVAAPAPVWLAALSPPPTGGPLDVVAESDGAQIAIAAGADGTIAGGAVRVRHPAGGELSITADRLLVNRPDGVSVALDADGVTLYAPDGGWAGLRAGELVVAPGGAGWMSIGAGVQMSGEVAELAAQLVLLGLGPAGARPAFSVPRGEALLAKLNPALSTLSAALTALAALPDLAPAAAALAAAAAAAGGAALVDAVDLSPAVRVP